MPAGDLPAEAPTVAGIAEGGFLHVKGVVEALYRAVKAEPAFSRWSHPLLHPGQVGDHRRRHPRRVVRAARELALEGVIAKRKDSFYESGKRSGAWVKSVNRGQEFVIGGYVPDHPFDSIIVGYYQDGKLYYAAKVRNGFVPRVRSEVFQRFKGLQVDACSFVNLPEKKRTQWALTREEMKNCIWLEPEVVGQIELGMDTGWPPQAFKVRRTERR